MGKYNCIYWKVSRNVMNSKSYTILLFLTVTYCLTYSQTIKTKTYMRKGQGKTIVSKIEAFDKNGNLVKEIRCYDNDCSKKDVEVYIYNNQGHIIEDSIFTNKYGYHQLIWRTKYTYYDNGKLKTEKKINEDCSEGFDDLNTYFYNNEEKLIKIYNQNACDNKHYFDYPIYFKYDSLGNQIEKIAKYRDTSVIFYKNVYQYDKMNNLISNTYYFHTNDSLELSSIKEYEYDSLSRLIQGKWIYSENNIVSTSYSYNTYGLLKSEMEHPKYSNSRISWIENIYDEKNNLTERQQYYLTDKGRKRKGRKQLIVYEYYEH